MTGPNWGPFHWAAFWIFEGQGVTFGASFFQPLGAFQMNAHVKSYLIFIAYMAVTKIVVAPVAKQLNIPVVSTILA